MSAPQARHAQPRAANFNNVPRQRAPPSLAFGQPNVSMMANGPSMQLPGNMTIVQTGSMPATGGTVHAVYDIMSPQTQTQFTHDPNYAARLGELTMCCIWMAYCQTHTFLQQHTLNSICRRHSSIIKTCINNSSMPHRCVSLVSCRFLKHTSSHCIGATTSTHAVATDEQFRPACSYVTSTPADLSSAEVRLRNYR